MTHAILAAVPAWGPRVDGDRCAPLLDEALRHGGVATALADAGYASASNQRYARPARGVRSVIPAAMGRPAVKPPAGRWRRRRRRQRLNKPYCPYGQRWQVEAVISMSKRRRSAVLDARSYWAQCREMMLLVLT